MKRQQTVWVKNNGDEPFEGRYDGEDFAIEPGEAIEIEADCAKLVFGFGEPDKTRAVRRLGWATSTADLKDAIARLGVFSFHMKHSEAEEHQACPTAPASDPEAAESSTRDSAATDQAEDMAAEADEEVRNQPLPKKRKNVIGQLASAAAHAAG